MKKYFLFATVILILGLLVNYQLDGFMDLKPQIVKVDDYVVYGVEFKGSYKSNKLNQLIDTMRVYQQQFNPNTSLVIVNYINESKETIGIINNFVGLYAKDSTEKIKLKFAKKKIIRASKAIRVFIKIRPLVMPSPERINIIVSEFALLNNFEIQNLSIEQYKETGGLVVDFPLKNL